MRRALLTALLPLLLGGCMGAGQPEPRIVLRPCSPMPVAPYSAAEQNEMADELERLRTNHPLRTAMSELRDWRIAGRLLTFCWDEEEATPRVTRSD